MAAIPQGMSPLHPGQLWVLRVRAALTAAALLVAVLIGDFGPLRETPVPAGFVTGIAVLLLAWWVIVIPGRRYRSWGYEMGEDELQIRHGIWTRKRTVVPFGRVQHIDVAQGPIERRFGVGTLILHTAGTRTSEVTLPGLGYEEAGRMRDQIRAQIRQDLL